jgi:hypothetical protein
MSVTRVHEQQQASRLSHGTDKAAKAYIQRTWWAAQRLQAAREPRQLPESDRAVFIVGVVDKLWLTQLLGQPEVRRRSAKATADDAAQDACSST